MSPDSENRRLLRTAVFGAGLWTLIEFFIRRVIGPAFGRVIGDNLANDMLISLVGAPFSAWIVGKSGAKNGFGPETRDYRWTSRAAGGGVAAGVVGLVSSAVTGRIDSALFGGRDVELFGDETPAVASGLLVAVNGVVVPVTEEFAWRGVVQTALVERFGSALGVGATSIAFALKHVIVDRSVSRFTTLLTLGAVLGIVRHRLGTGASTAGHVTANLTASALAVVAQHADDS
jgi:membrane protease YdiL (CAAX protease family)